MKTNTKFIRTMINYTAVAVLSTALVSCAHEKKMRPVPAVTPIAISASSTPAEEIKTQQSMMDEAYRSQVDVLAPIHFDEAARLFARATIENQKGAASDEIFKNLSMARGHLNKATEEAKLVQSNLEEVTSARSQALAAGARNQTQKLLPLDQKLKGFATTNNGSVASEQKTALQNQYLELELSSIKLAKLGNTEELLKQARTKGAEKTTPKAYNEAISKLHIADKLIETDRHSNAKIDAAVATASTAATRVLNLLSSEQSSRNQTPEERAVTLESRDNALKDADSTLTAVSAGSMKKDQQIAQQGEALAITAEQNKVLEKKE